MPIVFAPERLFTALDIIREHRGMEWPDVAKDAGIGSASTITRLADGAMPNVETLVALLVWSKQRFEKFLVTVEVAKREEERAGSPINGDAADNG